MVYAYAKYCGDEIHTQQGIITDVVVVVIVFHLHFIYAKVKTYFFFDKLIFTSHEMGRLQQERCPELGQMKREQATMHIDFIDHTAGDRINTCQLEPIQFIYPAKMDFPWNFTLNINANTCYAHSAAYA